VADSPEGDSATGRPVRIFVTLTRTRTVQTAVEIGRRSGLPSTAAHRIVSERVDAGLLERDDERRLHRPSPSPSATGRDGPPGAARC